MLDRLLLHDKVHSQLKLVLQRQPHALLLSGPEGSGKQTLVRTITAGILGISPETLLTHPYVLIVGQQEDSISIEAIRSLQQFLKLKVPTGKKGVQRVIIIDDAERMRAEAQNALLKTLEEPPADTMIIMSATHSDRLLPTITSRLHEIAILPVSIQQATQYFADTGVSGVAVSKAYALSQGYAGLLYALLHNKEHALIEYVEKAKLILSTAQADRLLLTEEFSKDKAQLRQLLLAFSRITHAALYQASLKKNEAAVKKWHQAEAAVLAANDIMRFNPNTKLLLDDLFLSL